MLAHTLPGLFKTCSFGPGYIQWKICNQLIAYYCSLFAIQVGKCANVCNVTDMKVSLIEDTAFLCKLCHTSELLH